MPRKQWTPEERKAWGEKMKAAKANKLQDNPPPTGNTGSQNVEPTGVAEPVQPSPSVPEYSSGTVSLEMYQELQKQVQELQQRGTFSQPAQSQAPQGAQVTQRGVIGTTVKYSLNPKDYPDPRDRLFQEPLLTLQGFNRDWFDLEWRVNRLPYDTKEGLHMVEPRFEIDLIRIVPDEEGMPSAKRYILHKAMFFEDPEAAIQVAHEQGLDIPEEVHKDFLDEMRYIRIRDWVKESFYPPKPSQAKANKTETVIGNRLVEVYEINSTSSETIPFQNLSKKL